MMIISLLENKTTTNRIKKGDMINVPFFILLYLYDMNLQESIRRILREERSLKTIVRDLVKNKGFLKASNVMGSLEKVHEILDLKGTQEDMIFIVNTILKHDLKEPMCGFVVSKWFHSIRTLVNIPLVDPNNPDAWVNRSVEVDLEEKISDMIYKLGNGLVRGNDINVSAVRCKLK